LQSRPFGGPREPAKAWAQCGDIMT